MEQAKLNRLNQWEQPPSEKTWTSICEALDRDQLRTRLAEVEIHPPSNTWHQIRKAKSDQPALRNRYALVSIFSLLLLGATYWIVSPTTNTSIETSKGTTPSLSVILNDPPKDLTPRPVVDAVQEYAEPFPRTEALSQTLTKKSAARSTAPIPSDYLLIASKTGEPLRLHLKWEYLSCCLSGETQNADCNQQQNKWHAEVLQTELGFQADSFMGLLALINAEH